MSKEFKIKGEDIKNIAIGYGGCIATDMNTIEGHKIGYIYRDEPNNEMDSGWCFMSGYESQKYMDAVENREIYDVNTIANYDYNIVHFIHKEQGKIIMTNTHKNV